MSRKRLLFRLGYFYLTLIGFFGRKIFFPLGPALLAYLSKAPSISTFVLMDRNHKCLCLAEPPIFLQKTGNRDEDLAVNTQRIAAILEKYIRLNPKQWYTFYDYFSRHKDLAFLKIWE